MVYQLQRFDGGYATRLVFPKRIVHGDVVRYVDYLLVDSSALDNKHLGKTKQIVETTKAEVLVTTDVVGELMPTATGNYGRRSPRVAHLLEKLDNWVDVEEWIGDNLERQFEDELLRVLSYTLDKSVLQAISLRNAEKIADNVRLIEGVVDPITLVQRYNPQRRLSGREMNLGVTLRSMEAEFNSVFPVIHREIQRILPVKVNFNGVQTPSSLPFVPVLGYFLKKSSRRDLEFAVEWYKEKHSEEKVTDRRQVLYAYAELLKRSKDGNPARVTVLTADNGFRKLMGRRKLVSKDAMATSEGLETLRSITRESIDAVIDEVLAAR